MKTKLLAGLCFCLTSAPLALRAAPGASAAGPNDFDRFRSASSPDGKSGETYVERAGRKEAMGDFSGAIADYTAAIGLEPKSETAHYYRAHLYSAFGKFREAIADLDVVIREDPKAISAYLSRGNAHAEMGQANAALADYDNAIRYAPNTAYGNLTEARAYYRKGDYSNAAARFARAKQKSSRDDSVLNSVAWFRATCPDSSFRNGKEALQESTKACGFTKWKKAGALDTLAVAYAELGDFAQAIKYQRQALSIKPILPDVLKGMQKRLSLYQAHKPFREEPKLRKAPN